MKPEYDFSKGKRGAVIPQGGKTRISIPGARREGRYRVPDHDERRFAQILVRDRPTGDRTGAAPDPAPGDACVLARSGRGLNGERPQAEGEIENLRSVLK
jgi:hypothetical protein